MNKRVIAIIMAAAMSMGACSVVLADNNEDAAVGNTEKIEIQQRQIQNNYIKYDITVKEAGENFIIADVDGVDITFNITEKTIFASKERSMPIEGERFIIVVDGDEPALMIEPPQYNAAAIVRTEGNVFVGKFKKDEDRIISEDGELVITLGESGYTFEDIENKDIMVVYSMSTMSLPPITNPDMVYILNENNDDVKVVSENKDEYVNPYVVHDIVIKNITDDGIIADFNETEVTFKVTKNTIFNSKTKDIPTPGESVKIVIDGNKPVTLQYPPVYTADAVIKTKEAESVYVGEFNLEDGVLVNRENTLALNIDEYKGYNAKKLDGNDLIVVYDISTRSIPAITNPNWIYVIKEKNTDFYKELKEIGKMKRNENKNNVDMYVNHIKIDFSKYNNVEPFIEDDYTLVPLRAIAEALGCEVSYDDNGKLITIKNDSIEVKLVLNAKNADVNGEEKELDKEAKVIDGRCVVPARFVSETFGHTVEWNADSLSVLVF